MFKYFLRKRINKSKSINLDITHKPQPIWKPLFLLLPAITIVTLFLIIPFFMSAQDGFLFYKAGDRNKADPIVGFGNFETLFNDEQFNTSMKNSILYALISIPITLVIALAVSVAISSLVKKWAKGFWQTLFFLPYVTSSIAIGLTFSYIFDVDRGFFNNILGMSEKWLVDTEGSTSLISILIYGIWRSLAFNILIFTTSILSVDTKLYKSSSIDGATSTKQFFTITLPAISRTTSFLFTMGLIGAVKVFPLSLFQNDSAAALNNNGGSLLLYIYHNVKGGNNELAASAGMILLILSVSYTIIIKLFTKVIIQQLKRREINKIQNKITSFQNHINKTLQKRGPENV